MEKAINPYRTEFRSFAVVLLMLAVIVGAVQAATDADGRANVKANGAKGDGHSDDSSAIRAAIDSLPAAGGAVVFPPGVYAISSTIAPNKRVRMICEGATGLNGSIHGSCRIFKLASFKGTALVFNGPSQGSAVEGLEIDGAKGNSGDGIQILANSIVLRDVAVVNQGGDGIRIGEDQIRDGTQANSFYLDRVRSANNNGHGYYVHKQDVTGPGFSDANAGTMINCVAQANAGDGLRIGKGINNTFIGFLSEGNSGAGVRLVSGAGNEVFVGGDLNEGNKGQNVVADSGNALGSYFFGTDTGKTVTDNGSYKSVFWNRNLGLTGGPLNSAASSKFAIGSSSVQTGHGAPSGGCETGSMYLRADGGSNSTFYVCEGKRWVAK